MMGSRHPPAHRCRCGKWLFLSYKRAVRVLHRLAEPGAVYWAPACGGYHLTHLTPSEFDQRQANRIEEAS